jgi:multidrug efflux pump subunit AcrB
VVSFLIHRPIAVTMTFVAVLILGVMAGIRIPVSLMPDINIPRISVQVSGKNMGARELENTIVSPMRRQLLQVAHLTDIRSETRNETATISLFFEYGADIDFAFIEVNEKIDRGMSAFPREVPRPRVIQASATDIPVYYLNLTLKDQDILQTSPADRERFPVSQRFVELSNFASLVICKRLEQLPEVAMADISGMVYPELLVMPDLQKLEAHQVSLDQLEHIIRNGNANPGNLLIRDGHYQYNVRFNATLTGKKDIEDLYIRVGDRLLQLKDVAAVVEHPQKRKGLVTFNGQDALTIAIVKQSDARMNDLKEKLDHLLALFSKDYPDVGFAITRDQTQLLEYSISNLNQSLLWGAVLAIAVIFLFLKDLRSPVLIGISMPASLIIALILFYLLDISINIISLAGLVLGLGMMIDNSIVVIDNITQHRERGSLLTDACVIGTHEVASPMVSSMLTGCAVFIPLIFLSGIAGALFYDLAMAVVIGHFASLLVSITLIPVYYRIAYRQGAIQGHHSWLTRINSFDYETLYEQSFRFVMRRQPVVWGIVAVLLAGAVILYGALPRSKMPPLTKDEIVLAVDWNERIHVEENNRRVQKLLSLFQEHILQQTCFAGEQQFLLNHTHEADAAEAIVYIKAKSPAALATIQQTVNDYFKLNEVQAAYHFEEADDLFNLIFPQAEAPLIARIRPVNRTGPEQHDVLRKTLAEIRQAVPTPTADRIAWQEHLVLRTDPVKLMMYDILPEDVHEKLKTSFSEHEVLMVKEDHSFVPIVMGSKHTLISEVLNQTYVANQKGDLYPLRELVTETRDRELKTIIAGQEGVYFPLELPVNKQEAQQVMEKLSSVVTRNNYYEVDFSGSLFSNETLLKELAVILIVSLALLYLILAVQFESLRLPLIVLVEIPIDIFGAFLFLTIAGAGINLMSLSGLVIMSGIIINDSILKVDTANKLMKEGHPLLKALLLTGKRRLKPIVMTTLVTVLAVVPLLFASGLGAELQKPLALALTGGMLLGTAVSLYFIPLCYYYLNRNKTIVLQKDQPPSFH